MNPPLCRKKFHIATVCAKKKKKKSAFVSFTYMTYYICVMHSNTCYFLFSPWETVMQEENLFPSLAYWEVGRLKFRNNMHFCPWLAIYGNTSEKPTQLYSLTVFAVSYCRPLFETLGTEKLL